MVTDLSKYNNSWYNPGRSFIVCALWYITNILVIKNSLNPFSYFKILTLRFFGAKIGKGVVIKPSVNIKYPWKLAIGNYSWIGENVWIDNLSEVVIGNNCCISQGAMLLCGNHDYSKETFDLFVKPIVLEDGVWIGAKAVITPGTVSRSHSMITTSSVSKGEMKEFTIYRGNPAIEIRRRNIA